MKRFAVIGLGRFGFHAAKALFDEGHEVIAIDSDRAHVQMVEPFCSEAIVLDATDKEQVRALGLEDMEAVVLSIGTDISNSILICLHLQEMGVKKIVAKALDSDHAKILRKVGATDIVHPEQDMARRIAKELSNPNILDFIPLEGDFTVLQISTPRSFVGKTMQELNLRAKYSVYVVAVKLHEPDDFIVMPPADHLIKETDDLVIIGKGKDVRMVKALK